MNIPKTVAAFALALLAAPLVHARIPFPAAGSLRINATTHSRGGSPSNAQSTQKVIKDPAEYNAYIAALNKQDPAAKAAAMEAFIKQYPQSVVLTDALEQAMAAYQQANNAVKVEKMAGQILQVNPNHVQALAVVCFFERAKATNANAVKSVGDDCAKGLQVLPGWTKPESITDDDFKKLRDQMAKIFNGACGFVALNRKDYAAARDFYLKSLRIDPNDMVDNYQLSIAELEANPMDLIGLWYDAKAVTLAQAQNNPAAAAIENYGKSKYHRYHGGDDGWNEIVSKTATESAPPPDFARSVKPAPTPAEIAVQAVKENDPATLSFSDYEFILSYRDASPANKEAAEKVWAVIQDMQKQGEVRLKLNGVKVIAATKDSIDAAISDENQQANKADLHVVLEEPALHPPPPGATIDIIGVLTGYTPSPFMFTMEKGELPVPRKPPSPNRPAKRP